MKSEEIVEKLTDSKDWEFDNYEGWFVARYKTMQIDTNDFTVRVYGVNISYEENSDKFEVFDDGGKIILEFYGDDIKNGSFNKTTYIKCSNFEIYFN